MRPKAWTQLTLTAPPHTHDLLIGLLTRLGFDGFLQEDETLSAFIARRRWSEPLRLELRRTVARLHKSTPSVGERWTWRHIKDQNWNKRWEDSAGIIEATDRIIIKPSWKNLRKKDAGKVVLHIDPKMSFGTGHHETTRLCLALLEHHLRPGFSVLDVGTGTGILAIAARKLGAKRVLALDIDEWSVTNARENIRRNGVTSNVVVRRAGFDRIPARRFDLVLANIDFPTIVRGIPRLLRALKPHGIIVMSGFLTSDLSSLFTLLQHRLALPLDLATENEWVALALLNLRSARNRP